jgi:hypothetical protein
MFSTEFLTISGFDFVPSRIALFNTSQSASAARLKLLAESNTIADKKKTLNENIFVETLRSYPIHD